MVICCFVSTTFKYFINNSDISLYIFCLSRPDAIADGLANVTADISPRIIQSFESTFSYLFPLPKMDQLAVPQGFPGAMENWGLSIYIEYTMLIDESQSSARDRDTINEVIAHELAHQWFGDLVTNDWWDVIWLNEGFAVYVSYIGMEAIAPEGENFDRFYVNVMEGVMRYDQHPSKDNY